MLEGIYIVIAVLLFFAQLQNGFFTAFLTAGFLANFNCRWVNISFL